MSDSTPEIPLDEQAAHDAAVDALLESTLAEDSDDLPPQEEAEGEEEEDSFEGPITYDEGEGDEEGSEEEPEETTPEWSKDDLATAWQALRRDGWTPEDIEEMDEGKQVRLGLAARERQRQVDSKLSARGQQAAGDSDRSEASEGQAEFDDSGESREFDDSAVGADLALEARPVVEKLMELDDPEEGARLLADLVSKTSQKHVQAALAVMRLEQRAEKRLAGQYEGDISKLMDEAQALGKAGRHADKTGVERFDALLEDALRLSGVEVARNTSTNRSRKARAARPPMTGKRVSAKPRSEAERLDARLNAILNGERDTSKLRSI